MLYYSDPHDWLKGNPNVDVKQILVFDSYFAKLEFEDFLTKSLKEDPSSTPEDINRGAVYKLKSCANSKGVCVASIRCGVSSMRLWESFERYPTHDAALIAARIQLLTMLKEDV